MDLGLSAIIVGVISAVGGIIVALLQRTRVENRQDHQVAQQQIRHVFDAVGRVEELLHGHIRWHREVQDGRVEGRVSESGREPEGDRVGSSPGATVG